MSAEGLETNRLKSHLEYEPLALYAKGRLALLLTLERAALEWRDNPEDELARLELCAAVDALRAPATIEFVPESPAPGAPSPHEPSGETKDLITWLP